MDELRTFLKKNRLFLLLLALGLLLIALSGGSSSKTEASDCATENERRLEAVLSRMSGVGETHVLLSEENGRREGYVGAVVVCEGAASASVRLRVTEAVTLFTGLGSNKIMVEKTE